MVRDRGKVTSGAGGAQGHSGLRSCGVENRASELFAAAIRITWRTGDFR